MLNAYKKYWKNYVNFEGRSSRSDFWWVALINGIVGFIFFIMFFSTLFGLISYYSSYDSSYYPSFGSGFGLMIFLLIIWGLANFLPWLGLSVRRLRDAGYHWAFTFMPLIVFVPLIGWFVGWAANIALIVLWCQPSKPEVGLQSAYPGYTGGPQMPPYTDPNQQAQGYAQTPPQAYAEPAPSATQAQPQAYAEPAPSATQAQPQAYAEPAPSVTQPAPAPTEPAPAVTQSAPAAPVQEEANQASSFDFAGEPVAQNPAPEAVANAGQESNFDQAISSDDNGGDSAFL